MGQQRPARREAVDRQTGEIVQLALLGEDALARKPSVRYDWRPHPGRHVNVGKALMAKVWHRDSGYDQNDRDVLGYYLAHSPEAGAPLRMTYKEISQDLGIRQDTVSKSVGKLNRGGLLLEAEKIGNVRFFRVNPRAAFDGPAPAQVEATKTARHPMVPAPASPTRKKRRTAS
jgi:DNA-binding transcriptional ArsR family regulator